LKNEATKRKSRQILPPNHGEGDKETLHSIRRTANAGDASSPEHHLDANKEQENQGDYANEGDSEEKVMRHRRHRQNPHSGQRPDRIL
jgi:hypothetical protein